MSVALRKTDLKLVRLASIKAPLDRQIDDVIGYSVNITQLWAQSSSSRAASWFTDITSAAVESDPDPGNSEIQFPGVLGYEWVRNSREAAVCEQPAPAADIHTHASADGTQEHLRRGAYISERRGQVFWRTYTWEQAFAWRGNICLCTARVMMLVF